MNNQIRSRHLEQLYLIVLSVFISGRVCLDSSESLHECRIFLESNPKPQLLDFHYSQKHDGSMGHFTKFTDKFKIDNYFRLHQISSVAEEQNVTSLCVSIEDATAFSSVDYRRQPAFVTFHTKLEIPTCIVNVSASCWRASKKLETCNPVFIPMPGFMESALFNYPAFTENFWNYVQDDTIFRKGWISGIDIGGRDSITSINSSWVSRLNISSLTDLYIKQNNWMHPSTLFGSLPSLTRLDIPYNNIEILPEDTLNRVPLLRKLVLNHNNVSQLPSGLEKHQNLRALEIANPTGNATLTITDEEISALRHLEHLTLEGTKLKTNVTNILNLPNLKSLNMRNCSLGNIPHGSGEETVANSSLITLDLSLNNLTEFPRNTFLNMPHLNRLFLRGNALYNCSIVSFTSLVSLEYLDLSRNNFKYLGADCFYGLLKLTELDISWNQLSELDPSLFKKSILIEKLDLSNNKLSVISYEVLLPLHKLNVLDLSFNNLTQTPTLTDNELDFLLLANNHLTQIINLTSSTKIDYLDLSNNDIHELEINNVNALNLSYNSLSYIPVKMWDSFDKVKYIELGGNHFDCCRSETILLKNKVKHCNNTIRNLDKADVFTCFINDGIEVLLETLAVDSTLCPEVYQSKEALYIEIGTGVFLLVTMVAVASTLLYFYRTKLRYISNLLKMNKRYLEREVNCYKTCTYDAFVCYSGTNLERVKCELIFNLERDPDGYRLCIYDRDFALGTSISQNIISSLEKSRKVIFVLSQDFLRSQWGLWELEMASHKMLEEKRDCIILIELEKLDKKNIPYHLHQLIKILGCLKWPQDPVNDHDVLRFQKRLKDALGDSILKRTGSNASTCTNVTSKNLI